LKPEDPADVGAAFSELNRVYAELARRGEFRQLVAAHLNAGVWTVISKDPEWAERDFDLSHEHHATGRTLAAAIGSLARHDRLESQPE